MNDWNKFYLKVVQNIESHAPKKKRPSKIVFGVGDVTQYYHVDLVMLQSQHQSAPHPQQMVNERFDHL